MLVSCLSSAAAGLGAGGDGVGFVLASLVLALAMLASELGAETLAGGPDETSPSGAGAGLAAGATTVAPGSDACAGAGTFAGIDTIAEGCAADWRDRGLASLMGPSSRVVAAVFSGAATPALPPGGCRQRLDGMCDLEACGGFSTVVVVDLLVEVVVVVLTAEDC